MEMTPGCVVRSKAGRDTGRYLLVLSVEGKFALVADGDLRPLARPKRKNLRHLLPVAPATDAHFTTDDQLDRFLKGFGPRK